MKTKIAKMLNELNYRFPMEVTEKLFYKQSEFPVCPKCKISLEREYQSFCDRCGQKLSWKKYDTYNIKIRYAGDKSGKTYKYIIKANIRR